MGILKEWVIMLAFGLICIGLGTMLGAEEGKNQVLDLYLTSRVEFLELVYPLEHECYSELARAREANNIVDKE